MTEGIHRSGDTAGPQALLPMVFQRPRRAAAAAQAMLAAAPSDHDASIAYQVLGIVERDFGDARTAIVQLRRAVRLAQRCMSAGREGDAMASLGMALVQAGRSGPGLAALREAVRLTDGVTAARVRFRLGGALWVLGRHHDALTEVRRAVPVLRRSGDLVWTGRAVTLRALIHLALGAAGRSDRDFAAAEEMFARTDQHHDRAVAVHNRGEVALRAGDLPSALALLDQAEARYRALDAPVPELDVDYCAALLAAGLDREALERADQAVARLEAQRGRATRRAELLLVAARAAVAAGDPGGASVRAGLACRLFAAQQRDWWYAHGRLLLLQARFGEAGGSGRLVREAVRCADRLAALGSAEAASARLLAGRAALASRRPERARPLLVAAAAARHRGPVLSRVQGWLAQALLADAGGATRSTLDACRRGLALLRAYHATLGASELRAVATRHGAELAALALRACLATGSPRRLLVWSERWRATALAVPRVRPSPDRVLRSDLTRYRENASRLAGSQPADRRTPVLHREQRRLEQRIRARSRHQPAGPAAADELNVDELLAELGCHRLVQIIEVEGRLQVLLCGGNGAGGRVRRFPAGTAAEAATEVAYTRSMLHRVGRGAATRPEQAIPRLEVAGGRLETVLLGESVRHLGDGPVVVVPPGRLYAVPWALLPSLRERAVSVAPSARSWLRAQRSGARGQAAGTCSELVAVCGPGLPAAAAEVEAVAKEYEQATVLSGSAATADRVLSELDGCALAHLATHGTFRADSPMFSSLRLSDGPLTVYDLERLHRAPRRLVLPSCDSARLAPAGADELLGLAAALLPLGTVGVVASVVPVNDGAAAPLMLALHHHLRRGQTMAEALCAARAAANTDPVAQVTAWTFLALGAW